MKSWSISKLNHSMWVYHSLNVHKIQYIAETWDFIKHKYMTLSLEVLIFILPFIIIIIIIKYNLI